MSLELNRSVQSAIHRFAEGNNITIFAFANHIVATRHKFVVITIDPATGDRNPAILRAVASEREGYLGVYGSVVEPGTVAVGDPILLDK